MFQNRFHELSDRERRVIDLVVESFGMYSGKALKKITHGEAPWLEVRANCLPDERSNEVIPKEVIKKYFLEVVEQHHMDSVNGIRSYINSRLQMA